METLTAACLAVGLAVVLYVGRLGVKQRNMQLALDALQERMQRVSRHESSGSEPPARAA